MKDIRCLFGHHNYAQTEGKVLAQTEHYLICRTLYICTRCLKAKEVWFHVNISELNLGETGK